MKENKFYICKRCGNLVEVISPSGVPLVCCGQHMSELVPGTVEASREKHIPDVKVDGKVVTVTVGSVIHPMVEEHYLDWIYLRTDKGIMRKHLKAGEEPVAIFHLGDEKPLAAYAYCNLHGLWMAEIK